MTYGLLFNLVFYCVNGFIGFIGYVLGNLFGLVLSLFCCFLGIEITLTVPYVKVAMPYLQ